MRRVTVAVLAAAALAAAGCGAGAHTTARTELRDYLGRIALEQSRYETVRSQVVFTLSQASSTAADSSWQRAAIRLRRIDRLYRQLIARMRSIAPPASLRQAHAWLVRSLALYRRLAQNLEEPLRTHDVVALGRSIAQTADLGSRAHILRSSWRLVARATARRLGVPFPPILDHVGASLAAPAS